MGITDTQPGNFPEKIDHAEQHMHSAQLVMPAAVVTVTADAVADTLGAAATVGTPTGEFDIHWCVISAASQNANFTLVLYAGGVECGRVAFSRTNAFTASISVPMQTALIASGTAITAKLKDSVGGGTVGLQCLYHTYT